jgi:predicted ATPase
LENTGAQLWQLFYLGLIVEALAFAGGAEEGFAEFDQAIARLTESEKRWWDADLHRLRGDLLCRLPRPDLDMAEHSFRVALSIAREQGTKGFELRAATSLAQLLSDHGRRDEARQIVGAGLRLVHRGLRLYRPEGGKGAAHRAGIGLGLDPCQVGDLLVPIALS